MKAYFILCTGLLLSGCFPFSNNDDNAARRGLEESRQKKMDSLIKSGYYSDSPPPPAEAPAPDAGKDNQDTYGWKYTEKTDEMTSKASYFAVIDADNAVTLGRPYGDQMPFLVVSKGRDGRQVGLSVPKGIFEDGHYPNHSVLLRFDDEAPQKIAYQKSPDGSLNIIFLQSQSLIIAKLKKAKTLKIEAGFYQAGQQVITFNVDGFKWEH